MKRIREIAHTLKREIRVYQLVLRDNRTPFLGKVFLGLAIGYFFLPFDLIPDFIPVLGHVDDVIIIPTLIFIALKLIPKSLVEEHRKNILSR
jgi:uncharacterized membrane protein YkvA (DUF1232 family)